jgi:hypothetical protein
MFAPLDAQVATSLARAARDFRSGDTGARAGIGFEAHLFQALLDLHSWRHAAGPDQFDIVSRVRSRTGTRYEYDGAFENDDTLYIVEAKHLGKITREHISVFVMKLIDMLLGSADELGRLDVKPVFVSALPQIDAAAWAFAVAWGVLLISPTRLTPFELVAALQGLDASARSAVRLQAECEALVPLLWRPLNRIIVSTGSLRHIVESAAIFEAGRTSQVLDAWRECCDGAAHLGVTTVASTPKPI